MERCEDYESVDKCLFSVIYLVWALGVAVRTYLKISLGARGACRRRWRKVEEVNELLPAD